MSMHMLWITTASLVTISHTATPPTAAVAPATPPAASLAATPVKSLACTYLEAAMGPSYRWPTPNPGMVAPFNVVWNYPVYRNPLRSFYTGEAIRIEIPASFGAGAGFHIGKTAVPTKTDERYRLHAMSIRKPAQAYSGLGQALTHVMEMVLVHKQENGDRWANVIIPFQVSTDGSDMDIVNPIIDGAKLPDRVGESGYVMASAVSELQLAPAFDNATFSEFWGTAPCIECRGKEVNVRYMMRTSTLAIGVDTFQELSNALQNAPTKDPTQPPETTWTMGTCRNGTGTCVVAKSEDMQAKLKNMQKYQTQALTEQRSRKKDLDKKLKEVQAHKGPATNKSIAALDAATAAFNDLKAAASELSSAEANTAQIQTFATQAAAYKGKFDTAAPKPAAAVQTSQQNGPADIIAHPLPGSLTQVNTQDEAPSAADGFLSRLGGRGKRRVSI